MSSYSGLLVRDYFGDSGIIPSSGTICMSPDIIPYGTNVLSSANAVSTYNGPDIGQIVTNNINNNIYVRCKNIATSNMTGSVNLYYANSSVFLYPNTWTPISLPVTSNTLTYVSNGSTTIPTGGIGLVQAPFTLGGVPTSAHYCFIAVVNNNGSAFPIPASFASNAAFSQWVAYNPNVAWRNISLNPGSNANVTSYQTFGNANPVQNTMIFSLVGTNLPASGVNWQASCSDGRLSQPFSASGAFSSAGTASTQLNVPANITGTGNGLMSMAFTFSTANGQTFPSNSSIAITYYQVPTQSQTIEMEAKVAREFRIAATSENSMDGFEVQTLILLGSSIIQLCS